MADFGWAFVKGNLVTGSSPPSGAVQYNDGNDKFAASSDFTFVSGSTSQLNLTGNIEMTGDYNLTGNLVISGSIVTNELIVNVENRNVTNISATGSTQFGDSNDDTHIFTGSVSISASSNPLKLYGVQAGTPPNTSSYLALDSNYRLVLTSAAGNGTGGTIGAAEDGTYTDGLFSDFLSSTPIGTAIDKFNEILKIIVPGPSPSVDQINYTNPSGIATKLSFETGDQAPTGYTDVGQKGQFQSPPGLNSQYTVATSGEDFRLGVYNGTQEVTGVINHQVVEQLKSTEVNYSTDSFGNAESGSLKLYLNNSVLHTLDLNGFTGAGNPNTGSASSLNGNGSGFFDISTATSATDQNGSTYDIFKHRTAKFVVDPADQNKGWNYVKVDHVYGATTYTTNFIQWFNDTDASSQTMTVTNPRVTFTGGGSKYLSGVQYFRSSTLVYNSEVNNAYKFTYPTGSVLTFNVDTNDVSAIAAQSMPATDGTDLYNKILKITGSTATVDNTMLNDSTTISINLDHPLKTNLASTGSVATSGILIYNVDTANNNLTENFDLENFRITSHAYSSQSDVTSGDSVWNSQNHMLEAGPSSHRDGLLMYNGRLYSPKQGANGGNFSTLANGPASNPNYSGVSGTRTFFRKIQNTSGATIRDLKISTSKATRFDNETLTTNNVKFSIKVPGATGFMDISQNFSYGNTGDDAGALINGASDNSNTLETDTGDATHCITFGTQPVANNEYVVVRIEADESWTGFINTLTFQLGASDDASAPTAAPALDDIDLSDTAGETAKLSFGTSNGVVGYTNVAGGVGSMSAVNSNGLYTDNEDTNRGVFKASEVMTGVLNQDVAGSGNNYPANSFLNAYTGSLLLVVNDATVSTLSLANLNSTNNLADNTGFSVGTVGFSTSTDNVPDYTKPYRTGTYSIGTAQQRSGWNYARVLHRIGAADTQTNYVQWVVDPSGSTDDTAISTGTLARFSGDSDDYYYSSGIAYFTTDSAPTASFTFTGSNFYSNVYYNGADGISFPTTTNCSINNTRITGSGITTFNSGVSQASMPPLNNTADCELTSIEVTGNVLYSGGTSIMSDLGLFNTRAASIEGRVKHVANFKSDRDTSTRSSSTFMFYSGSIGSTTLSNNEYFGLETHRIVSGNYANQADLTSESNTWNSETHMNAANAHGDGMVTANGYLLSPLKIGDDGDTRNATDGGSLEAPAGNPNYSSLTDDVRSYYRVFRYTGASTVASFTATLYGDATLRSIAPTNDPYYAALGVNKNCNVELKISYDPNFPGADDQSTGWADLGKIFDSGNQPNNDGAGIRSGASTGEDVSIDTNGLALSLTLGTRRIKQNQYYVVKITAHKDWTGYISRIQVAY